MSSYQPSIPTGLVNLDVDYANIQANFSQADTTFGIDHYKFSDQTAQNGIHKQIRMPNQSPALGSFAPGNGMMFASLLNGNSWPVWQNALGNTIMMSSATVNLASGYCSLPGGMLMQWGNFDPNSSINVTFPVAFAVIPFTVQLTGSASNNSTFRAAISTGSLTTAGFTFQGTVDSHWTPIYWLAIGRGI